MELESVEAGQGQIFSTSRGRCMSGVSQIGHQGGRGKVAAGKVDGHLVKVE